jgi:hypothetical protein
MMGTDNYESAQATVVTRNRALRWLAASPFLVTLFSIALGATVSPRFFGATILSLIAGALLSGLVQLLNPLPWRDRSALSASPTGLTTAAGLSIARRELSQGGLTTRSGGGATVVLERKGFRSSIEVELPSLDEGKSLLSSLGLDPAHSIASFYGMSRVCASWAGFWGNTALLFLGPAGLGWLAARAHSSAVGVIAALVAFIAYISFFMPMRLDVGGDGVIVRWYGRKRFIPYADVETVVETTGLWPAIRAVVLRTRTGEEISLPLSYGLFGRAATAAARVRAALAAYERGDVTAEAASLARGERSTTDWILALRQIGTGANAGPRTSPVATDTLWRIVETAGENASVRAAAAIALAPTLTETERARLATVADGTTAPKLRIALEAAATSDDDAIAEALLALDADEESSERSRSA